MFSAIASTASAATVLTARTERSERMSGLVLAIALIGAICGVLSLLISLGSATRINRFMASLPPAAPPIERTSIPVPESLQRRISEGTDTNGSWFATPTLVVFVSAGCSACGSLLTQLVAERGIAAFGHRIAIVEDGPHQDVAIREAVRSLHATSLHDSERTLAKELAITAFPSALVVRDNIIVLIAKGDGVAPLLAAAAAETAPRQTKASALVSHEATPGTVDA